MNLSVETQRTQPATPPVQPRNRQQLLEAAADHVQAAARISDVDDLRYFNMRDLQELRINMHLALELLEIVKRQNQ